MSLVRHNDKLIIILKKLLRICLSSPLHKLGIKINSPLIIINTSIKYKTQDYYYSKKEESINLDFPFYYDRIITDSQTFIIESH